MLKFEYIPNFELTFNILEHPKPSISSLKQPSKLTACYLENKTPLDVSLNENANTVSFRVVRL